MWARRLAGALPSYLSIAWWGLVSPRRPRAVPLVVHQAVVLSERGVLLTVRRELRGWELPGGEARPGESGEDAVCREVREETGLEVRVSRLVGEYRRSGFRPHTARVYACRPSTGALRPSPETPRVRWFDLDRLPDTLFPWFAGPLADALAQHDAPVERCEHWGPGSILAGLAIDLRMRWTDDRAGS